MTIGKHPKNVKGHSKCKLQLTYLFKFSYLDPLPFPVKEFLNEAKSNCIFCDITTSVVWRLCLFFGKIFALHIPSINTCDLQQCSS
jgi:hypothetical protein